MAKPGKAKEMVLRKVLRMQCKVREARELLQQQRRKMGKVEAKRPEGGTSEMGSQSHRQTDFAEVIRRRQFAQNSVYFGLEELDEEVDSKFNRPSHKLFKMRGFGSDKNKIAENRLSYDDEVLNHATSQNMLSNPLVQNRDPELTNKFELERQPVELQNPFYSKSYADAVKMAPSMKERTHSFGDDLEERKEEVEKEEELPHESTLVAYASDQEAIEAFLKKMAVERQYILFGDNPASQEISSELITKQQYIRNKLKLNDGNHNAEFSLEKAFKIIDALNMQTLFVYDKDFEKYRIYNGEKCPTDASGDGIYSYFAGEDRECVICAEDYKKGSILMKLSA